ncbi:hypothetical protein [Stenotrophomonas sp. VV52]|uniref:hypothetical protein n=1 Tax=Stenotrophomonas sp. VV52 TaxID=2066958 RepID=UPI00155986CA|nr:hypothetical protein [Stenotrophomonas sp. VV52]
MIGAQQKGGALMRTALGAVTSASTLLFLVRVALILLLATLLVLLIPLLLVLLAGFLVLLALLVLRRLAGILVLLVSHKNYTFYRWDARCCGARTESRKTG